MHYKSFKLVKILVQGIPEAYSEPPWRVSPTLTQQVRIALINFCKSTILESLSQEDLLQLHPCDANILSQLMATKADVTQQLNSSLVRRK